MAGTQRNLVPVSLPSGWDEVSDVVLEQMVSNGYVWFQGGSHELAMRLKTFLGEPVYETHVREKVDSKAMLSKKSAIGPHTDHHAVDFILWYVHDHCDTGGETLIYPIDDIIDKWYDVGGIQMYHPKYRNLKCKEHRVFEGDPGEHLVIQREGSVRTIFRNMETSIVDMDPPLVYYSFWLADHQDDEDAKRWFKLFQMSIECTTPLRGHLKKGDIFIFDNRRNLHSRTEYFDSKRHLERHWIKAIL